jgi:hypothetical protein
VPGGAFNRGIATYLPAFLNAAISLVYRPTSRAHVRPGVGRRAFLPNTAHDIIVSRFAGDVLDCRAATVVSHSG